MDELLEAALVTDDAHRRIAGVEQLLADLHDPAQHVGQVEVARQLVVDADQVTHPRLGAHHLLGAVDEVSQSRLELELGPSRFGFIHRGAAPQLLPRASGYAARRVQGARVAVARTLGPAGRGRPPVSAAARSARCLEDRSSPGGSMKIQRDIPSSSVSGTSSRPPFASPCDEAHRRGTGLRVVHSAAVAGRGVRSRQR